MKKCPKCGYTVVKNDYCKICDTCVIYEEHIITEGKMPGFNRYIFLYNLKKFMIPAVSLLAVLIFTILIGTVMHEVVITAIFFAAVSVIVAVAEDPVIDLSMKYLTEEYARFRVRFTASLAGIAAVILIIAAYCFR